MRIYEQIYILHEDMEEHDLYKLIAIDIDGTLLNERKELTKEVHDAIQAAREKGVLIVLCTGRPIGGVQQFIKALSLNKQDDYAITFNGALVQNNFSKEIISATPLTYGDLKLLHAVAEKLQSPMHFFDTETVYTSNKDISVYTAEESFINKLPLKYRTIDEIPEDMVIPKVMFVDEPDRLNKIIADIPEDVKEKYEMVKSAPYFFEILDRRVSKGNAVKQLAEKLGILREEVICIGDNENDLSMIKYAGCGVAMANAIPAVKEVADFHTLSNNENGVAYAIEQLVLNK